MVVALVVVTGRGNESWGAGAAKLELVAAARITVKTTWKRMLELRTDSNTEQKEESFYQSAHGLSQQPWTPVSAHDWFGYTTRQVKRGMLSFNYIETGSLGSLFDRSWTEWIVTSLSLDA